MADSLKTLLGLDSTGGGAWPINAVFDINDDADLRVKNGQTWLKTGVIETDTSLYPDAKKTLTGLNYQRTIDLSSTIIGNGGMASLNGKLFIMVGTEVYRFLSDWTYDNFSFSIPSSFSAEITSDGEFLWFSQHGSTDELISYNENGVVQSGTVPLTNNFTDYLAWDSNREKFLVYEGSTAYLYDLQGNRETLKIGASGYRGLSYDSDRKLFFTTVASPSEIVVLDADFNELFRDSLIDNSTAVDYFDGNLYIGNGTDVYEYTPAETAGIATAYTNSDTGLPYYTRVK